MNKKLTNIFYGTSLFLVTIMGPEIGQAQREPGMRMGSYDSRADNMENVPSKKQLEEERKRAQEAAAAASRAAAAERERIKAQNEAELRALNERINADTNALKSNFEGRLIQLDAEWIKKFENLKAEILEQDAKDRIQAEIENHVLDLIIKKKDEINRIVEQHSFNDRRQQIGEFFAKIEAQKTLLPVYQAKAVNTFALPNISWSNQIRNETDPMAETRLAESRLHGNAEAQKILAAALTESMSSLQSKWVNQLEALMQNDDRVNQLLESLKKSSERIFEDEMKDL